MLGQSVLVLNRLWQAVHITNARRAFGLLYVGRAKALTHDFSAYDWEAWRLFSDEPDADGADFVHSVSQRLLVPRVIQLLHFDRLPRSRVKFTRANIYTRDKYRCQYCGRQASKAELNIDHLVPRSRGGRSTWENVVVACIPCNRHKADRLPTEAGMSLIREPQRPRWNPAMNLTTTLDPHPEWQPFLQSGYFPQA